MSIGQRSWITLDEGPLLSSAWAGWMCFDSEVEVEAAKGTTGLCSGLSSCFMRCTPVAEEEDYHASWLLCDERGEAGLENHK
jgi:hypothetical protein